MSFEAMPREAQDESAHALADADSRVVVFESIAESRRSAYAYLDDPVPRALVERAIRVAMFAPNHRKTSPWRFFVYAGAGRAPLVAAYEAAARRLNRDAAKARQRALDAPVMIVVACIPQVGQPKVLVNEEEFATAAAIQNMLLALTCANVSTLLTTGDLAESQEMHALVGLGDGQGRIMAVVNVGYRNPARPVPPRAQPDLAKCVRWIESP
jgi:nitroreductase